MTFHRQARRMRDLRSELDGIPGVGPRRRRTLLRRFGSRSACAGRRGKNCTVVGARCADAVLAHSRAAGWRAEPAGRGPRLW
ncbi:MAG: hypothetical protein R2708_11410 [Vicinamibacterales bacterium]